jgi:glycosyltransferase involved in cell wall biosynthesis
MRVAIISRVFSKSAGGAESYSVALVQHLAARHDIHVFSQESNQPVAGVIYHRIFCLSRKPRWINLFMFAMSTWWQTRRGFDVVHSHENTWHGQIQTIHVRPLRHNLFFSKYGVHYFLRWVKVVLSPRLITYMVLEGARFKAGFGRRIVATSENLRTECTQAYPDSPLPISVITPGTNCHPNLPSRQLARKILNLPQESPLILFVANDYARKGLDTLLNALASLSVDVGLVVVGNPQSAPRYRHMAESMGLEKRIYFLGSLEDLTPAYCAAECLAHPTLEDSFAMVVLEAMAHGLPVVVSGPMHCGISRQLTQGVDALFLENPKDAQTLAELVGSVLNNTDLAATLRSHGLKFAEKHSWDSAALQYEQLYFQAVSKR